MLPKKKRVTKELFLDIMKNGRVIHGSLFLFRYIDQKDPHYAFVAPKSIAKGAVLRNKLRRQGYNTLKAFPLISNAGIFFYKKGSNKAKTEEIKKDIDLILKKAHF